MIRANIVTSIGTFFNVDKFIINQGQEFKIELQPDQNETMNIDQDSWTTNNDRVLSLDSVADGSLALVKATNTGTSLIRVLTKDSDNVIKKIEVSVESLEAIKLQVSFETEKK